jgi:hypothetical protein
MATREEQVGTLQAWFAGRLPDDWFTGSVEVTFDRDEILVVGRIAEAELDADATDGARRAARQARIERFREDTRLGRMRIADDAEVMTRLRLPERTVLDTLVDSGVARSRSDALAWCVRLVAANQSEWLDNLRDALVHVEKVRAEGPSN